MGVTSGQRFNCGGDLEGWHCSTLDIKFDEISNTLTQMRLDSGVTLGQRLDLGGRHG